jgi:hypothetical protein
MYRYLFVLRKGGGVVTRLISTIAGTGTQGYTGDGGLAVYANLSEPFMCELDHRGNICIVDATNHCIRLLNKKNQVISTVAGTGVAGYSGDGGLATLATFNEPYAVQIDANGDIYIVDRLNAAIRKIECSSGIITTLAGGTASGGYIEPNDCFLDSNEGLIVADVQSQKITRINLKNGDITELAGNGEKARKGDGMPALEASIFGARAVCKDTAGNLYICEREGNGVRRVDTAGIMSTIAGTGADGYEGDGGTALESTWNGPKAIRCDNDNNLVVVDTENHAVRGINLDTLKVQTIAGGHKGRSGDGGPALSAGLNRPHACSIDNLGNLYIADSDNHRVRMVSI